MTRLLVEVTDFVDASKSMYSQVADPTDIASGRLASTLLGLGAMAGDDPAGQGWAKVYDRAAASALLATQQVVNAAYKTSSMFGRSGLNYAEADTASTTSAQSAITTEVQGLPPDGWSGPPPKLPSAAGGGGGHPTGWDLVKHLIGYVWPDGHQDRLHRAAQAWTTAADELEEASFQAAIAPIGFARDALPEADDMCTVCRGLADHCADLASAYRALATACTDLAHHIDVCHDAVEDELHDLLAWSAGIQAGGALLSVVTIGIAEAPTQGAQVAKIAAAAKKIEELILAFITAARSLADTLPSVAMAAERIRVAMEALSGARLAVAGMEAVPGAKTAATAANEAKLPAGVRGEIDALKRLEQSKPVSLHRKPHLLDIRDPKKFDPQTLRGISADDARAGIPKSWKRRPSTNGDGTVYEDPRNRGRQIRIMKGYPAGSRPDPITTGPYAVVSQAGKSAVKIPLKGNPTL